MKKSYTKIGSFLSVAVLTGVAASTLMCGETFLNLSATEDHSWNHYAAVAPTETTAGNLEYWACCTHHEISLTEPTAGTITDATNPDFASVEAGTEYNEAYLYAAERNTTNIGYEFMAKTGAETPTYVPVGDPLENVKPADIGLTTEPNNYGSSAKKRSPADDAGGGAVAGALMYSMGDGKDAGESVYASLPRINFSLYEKVTMEYGIDTYNMDIHRAEFGFHTSDDLRLFSKDIYGTLVFTAIGNKLQIESKYGETTKTVEVNNKDIVNGTDPLLLKASSKDWRTLYLNNIYYKSHNHTHDLGTVSINPDKVGYKTAICNICGETVNTDEIMMQEDVRFVKNGNAVKNYGVKIAAMTEGLTWPVCYPAVEYNVNAGAVADGVTSEYVRFCIQPKSGVANYTAVAELSLPRIDYSAYSKASIKFKNNTYIRTSFVNSSLQPGTNYIEMAGGEFVVEVTNVDGVYTATIKSLNSTAKLSTTLTDTSVINGDTSIKIYISTQQYGNLCMVAPELVALA